jgi:eukaryotic-like serine/threonine-protein kinase
VGTINLNRAWQLGDELASGGFGHVYEAEADDGSAAVVKLVPKAPGASRELLFEELFGLPNIIPILDSGEWQDYYVLVMPRADKSLRQHLADAGGRLPVEEAVAILTDVAEALASLEAGVVHRDLKPENVLLYEGHWCLADFGIARYAEATTAPDTHKFAMTPRYAAPEQWRGERATSATDVYALGVLAFEVLQDELLFPGPDFRQQHLNQPPPPVEGCPPTLASLINECLFKPAAARPTPANILARLRASQRPPSPAAAKLQAVQKAVVEKQGEEAARMSAEQSKEEARRDLFEAAKQSFERILDTLRQRALEEAPATNASATRGGLTLRLGDGALIVDPVQAAPADCLAAFDYEPPFDVIAYTAIAVKKPRDRYDYEGRAHSLWYCDAHDEGIYRWFELAFMVNPMVPQRYSLDPFALPPTDEHAAGAFVPVIDVRQVAWQPLPFDQGDEEQFIERWLEWFAAAVDGSLSHPPHMPESSGGRYRLPRQRQR